MKLVMKTGQYNNIIIDYELTANTANTANTFALKTYVVYFINTTAVGIICHSMSVPHRV